MPSGIYEIVNTINGKMYIGSAVSLSGRFRQHRFTLKNGKHGNVHLQRAWNKYGPVSFVFSVIEYVAEKDLLAREQYWIDAYGVASEGYNICPIAGSNLGLRWSEEAKRKASIAKKGTGCGEDNPFHGKKHTQESKDKMSRALKGHEPNSGSFEKGHVMSDETKRKIRLKLDGENHPMYGKHHTKESLEKMSAAKKGQHSSPQTEFKKRLVPWNKGKTGVYSKETLAKMAAAKKENPSSSAFKKGHKFSRASIDKGRRTRKENWLRERDKK
ncbi:hypothetical protein LCGC14_0905660 [marine sediment metagenome]|uniref:GIY-YIG domain-containing protein n=1 Tax=marine sediment metagenome TaxID=412755 RepID=A0A0F9PFW8_9ZZZZ